MWSNFAKEENRVENAYEIIKNQRLLAEQLKIARVIADKNYLEIESLRARNEQMKKLLELFVAKAKDGSCDDLAHYAQMVLEMANEVLKGEGA